MRLSHISMASLNNPRLVGVLPTNIYNVYDNNWTRVEAIQQGLTADVNCTNTPDSDSDIRLNQTIMADGIMKISSCCNCTLGEGSPILVLPQADPEEWNYLTFAVCPISDADDIISMKSIPLCSFVFVLIQRSCIHQWRRYPAVC